MKDEAWLSSGDLRNSKPVAEADWPTSSRLVGTSHERAKSRTSSLYLCIVVVITDIQPSSLWPRPITTWNSPRPFSNVKQAALPHGWEKTKVFCRFKTGRKSRYFHLLLQYSQWNESVLLLSRVTLVPYHETDTDENKWYQRNMFKRSSASPYSICADGPIYVCEMLSCQ